MREKDEEIIKDLEKQIEEGRELEGARRVNARVSKNLTAVFAIRLSREDLAEFDAAAKARGVSLADFMRNSTRAAIAGDVDVDKAAAVGTVRELAREMAAAVEKL